MKIFLLSDSHGDDSFLTYAKDCDFIIHCGDLLGDSSLFNGYRYCAVSGNCDRNNLPWEEIVDLDKLRFWVTHGHHEQVKYSLLNLTYGAMERKVNVCCYGHTHVPTIWFQEGITFINPGAYLGSHYFVIFEGKTVEFYRGTSLVRRIIDCL